MTCRYYYEDSQRACMLACTYIGISIKQCMDYVGDWYVLHALTVHTSILHVSVDCSMFVTSLLKPDA